MNTFGDRIKAARLELELSQEEFAKKLGVGRTTITGYEKNHIAPTISGLIQACEILRVWPEYLLGRSKFKTQKEFEDNLYDQGKFSTNSNSLEEEIEKIQILLENDKLKFLDNGIPDEKRKIAILHLEHLLELLRI